VFNNGNEQGLVLTIYNESMGTCIWAGQDSKSDDLMIVIDDEQNKVVNHLFTDKAYKGAQYFKRYEYDKAIDKTYKMLQILYKNELTQEHNFDFELHKSLSYIKRTRDNIVGLDYEDPDDLATLKIDNSDYYCDLIILDGKLLLKYRRFDDSDYIDIDDEELVVDLSNDTNLLCAMKNKLEDYIENAIMKELESDENLKISNLKI